MSLSESEAMERVVAARGVCTYLRGEFLSKMAKAPEFIVEVGARDLLDSACLAERFPEARILSYECHPDSIKQCSLLHRSLPEKSRSRIQFVPVALGAAAASRIFYPFTQNNPGASSFYFRTDGKQTQTKVEQIAIRTLAEELAANKWIQIDLLCMDIQGFELEVLKGADCSKIKYVIMEEPNGTYPHGPSHYMGAPSRQEISKFMKEHGFTEIARSRENDWEDNVMYARSK